MTMNGKVFAAAVLCAAAGAIALSITASQNSVPALVREANAAPAPRVIEITAKRYQFSPSEITLKKDESVILRLSSADRTHGFLLKPLKIDTDITPGKPTDIAVTPTTTGEYIVICDHYCGTGHGNMKLKLSVVE